MKTLSTSGAEVLRTLDGKLIMLVKLNESNKLSSWFSFHFPLGN